MANTEPMTQDDIQKAIHGIFSNDTDTPASGDDDYKLRTTFINLVIEDWQQAIGTDWEELWSYRASDTYQAANQGVYSTAKDFRWLGKKMKLVIGTGVLEVPIIRQRRVDDDNLPECYCFVSGKPGAYKLNFVGVPAEWEGASIRYRYYRYATKLTGASDVPDMSNPLFIVYRVAARLFQLGRNNSGANFNNTAAQDAFDGMVTRNQMYEAGEEEAPMATRIRNFGTMGS
jgi:hypothetical protein